MKRAPAVQPNAPKRASAKRGPSIRPPRIFLYFDTVVRCGSIRKAAEALRIASSAVNRQILLLESEIGCELLERLPRGVRLTAAGETFANYVRQTLADLEAVGSQIELLRGLVRGKVKIATVELAAGEFLPRLIGEFQREHPGVDFSVTVGTPDALATALLNDSADALITHETVLHKDISVVARAPQSFCALLAKDHPLASRKRLQLRECAGYPIALADNSLAGRSLIEQAMATGSFRFQPALTSNSVATMKAYARLCQAICFQFEIGCRGELASGEMVAIPLGDRALQSAELIVATRRERVLPVAAAAFVELARLAFRDMAAR